MPGHFKDDDHKAEELQEVACGARHDRRSVRDAHLLVRTRAKVLEVAVKRWSKGMGPSRLIYVVIGGIS